MLGRLEIITAEAPDMPLWGTAVVEPATAIVACRFHHNLGTSSVGLVPWGRCYRPPVRSVRRRK